MEEVFHECRIEADTETGDCAARAVRVGGVLHWVLEALPVIDTLEQDGQSWAAAGRQVLGSQG